VIVRIGPREHVNGLFVYPDQLVGVLFKISIMSTSSRIEWTEITWNPTTGCDKISTGCKFCYAEVMTRRLKGMGQEKYQDGFKLRIHEDELKRPYKWRGSRMVFVDSMSDLFHHDVPFDFIDRVMKVIRENPQHTFQVLTKRSSRLLDYEWIGPRTPWPENLWLGVSVESELYTKRITDLSATTAHTKFLSLEPLLGPIENMQLGMIDWVIVGGESGRKPRPMREEWVTSIRDQCARAGVKFFFKQWGGKNKKESGRLLQGRTYDEIPERLPIKLHDQK